LLSDPQPRQLVNKTQSSKASTSKLASELAQIYSISNSKVALTGALVLGGVLALNQVQAANAAPPPTWVVGDADQTFDGGLSNANVTRITFGGNTTTITTAGGIPIDRVIEIDGALNGGRVTIQSTTPGTCIICSNSSVTLNNLILDATGLGVTAVKVDAAPAAVNVGLSNVEIKNASGASAVSVSGQAATTVTITNSSITNNIAATSDGTSAGGSVIVVNSAAASASVTISGTTTITSNQAGDGVVSDPAGSAGGSIVAVTAATGTATVTLSGGSVNSNIAGSGGTSSGSIISATSTSGPASVTLNSGSVSANTIGTGVTTGGSVISATSLAYRSHPSHLSWHG
jgi:fibronectin-binding autotransporter adhesin